MRIRVIKGRMNNGYRVSRQLVPFCGCALYLTSLHVNYRGGQKNRKRINNITLPPPIVFGAKITRTRGAKYFCANSLTQDGNSFTKQTLGVINAYWSALIIWRRMDDYPNKNKRCAETIFHRISNILLADDNEE